MRQYLYIEQLGELAPWSATAIRTMMARGVFKEGVHYFKHGVRSRPIFSWAAIVEYIEGTAHAPETPSVGRVPLANGTVIDIHEVATALHRLHR